MGHNEWEFPDFTTAPLLEGLMSHLWHAGGNKRPLWENAISDSRFRNLYLQYCQQLVAYFPEIVVKMDSWSSLIRSQATASYYHTDSTTAANNSTGIVSTTEFDAEFTRIKNFLEARKTYIETGYSSSNNSILALDPSIQKN